MSRPPGRPGPTASTSSLISSPSLSAPPIRMRHPLPAPPHHHQQRPPRASSSSSSTRAHSTKPLPPASKRSSSSASTRYSPRHAYPSASPSTSPYYSSSHPSPAASSTSSSAGSSGSGSSSSSLRTPPDLLVNGSSVGHSVPGKGGLLAVNSWNGLPLKPRLPSRSLSKDEIRRRQTLLQNLPHFPTLELPSPPPSPKREEPDPHFESSRKRKREASPGPKRSSLAPIPYTSPPPSATASVAALASAYRSAARTLKHSADARASNLSASRPSYLASRPTELSALEQLDAVLLFAQAFWLDDLCSATSVSGGGGCIAKNWISLFGLLRYATNAHSDLGNDVLLGVCRLVEAAVLRKLHAHDSALLLSKMTTDSFLEGGDEQREEVRRLVERQTADLERSDRLATQARSLVALPTLAACYPQLHALALASATPHSEAAAAKAVDPSHWPGCTTFAFPLDATTPIPHLVAFGRCALREHAHSKSVAGFQLVTVASG